MFPSTSRETPPSAIDEDCDSNAMNSDRASGFLNPATAMAAVTRHKAEAIKLAKEQGSAVREMCRRSKIDPPPYEFEELIGKGAYGRVYKGRQLSTRQLVAIKVMDIDAIDYKALRDFRDESIKDFVHETKVLTQVKDAGAKNVNELIETISIHTQLWLVCEYCPGGSVRTLMRATGDRLEERFIIPIARELAEGLRAIHAAGVIHRDVKAANILIHEEGRLQICDFGVAGVLQSQLDKRSTWIGTPHWMPPEMFSTRGEAHHYGSEVDVWAYGCTLFEFATGSPPNSNLRERMQIGRQLSRTTPKLDGESYSQALKDIVTYTLDSNPASRPAMVDIISHPYIAGSEQEYPTSSLSELVRIYYQWSQAGGQRASLFHPGGAVAAQLPSLDDALSEDWSFSTTDNFERRYSVLDLDQLAASLAELEAELDPTHDNTETADDEPVGLSGSAEPVETARVESDSDTEMTPEQRANFEERVRRGAEALAGLFDESKPSYNYVTKNDFVPIEQRQGYSDLPLRSVTDRSSVTSTFIDIDIGAFDSAHYAAGSASTQPFQLVDADTIRATRSSGRTNRNSNEERSSSSLASSFEPEHDIDSQDVVYETPSGPRPPTMEWSFPAFMKPPGEENAETEGEPSQPTPQGIETYQSDKRATMEWTFPVMSEDTGVSDADKSNFSTLRAPIAPEFQESTIRPHEDIGEPGDSRPSTAGSGSIASGAEYDPFRYDQPQTPPGNGTFFNNLSETPESTGPDSYEQSPIILDGPGPDEEDSNVMEMHPASSETPELFPTAIPANGRLEVVHTDRSPSLSVSMEQHANIHSALPTARHQVQPTATKTARDLSSAKNGIEPIQFPNLTPPSLESLVESADASIITAELDRLLGDFLGALSATGDALSRVKIGPENPT